jgi:ribosomal protein L4
MARKATAIMLSYRLKNEELEFVNIPVKKPAELRSALLKNIQGKTLIVTNNEDVKLAMRNVENILVFRADKLNAKHLAMGRKVLVDNDVVNILEERLTNGK